MNNRPDVTDEDIGMRTFQIRKAKAVERAAERLRQGLKASWQELTTHEIEELEWVLGELWAYIARDDWEHLRFGLLSMHDLRVILGFGRELRKHSRNAVDVLSDVGSVVRAKG
ncbi:MAG: hypothetical protein Q8K99_01645 [Actinomycetota bacterium]|nr:hypothetical protein [Actinomycetota bacterium]